MLYKLISSLSAIYFDCCFGNTKPHGPNTYMVGPRFTSGHLQISARGLPMGYPYADPWRESGWSCPAILRSS